LPDLRRSAPIERSQPPKAWWFFAAAAVCLGPFQSSGPCAPAEEARYFLTLKSIYTEVKEMGARPGENFIQREFFIGAPDDDDTNKNISVNIFIQTVEDREDMRIEVTYMERTPENEKVKLAKNTKFLNVLIQGGALRIARSDYGDRELGRLTKDILESVKNKKRLLRLKSCLDHQERGASLGRGTCG